MVQPSLNRWHSLWFFPQSLNYINIIKNNWIGFFQGHEFKSENVWLKIVVGQVWVFKIHLKITINWTWTYHYGLTAGVLYIEDCQHYGRTVMHCASLMMHYDAQCIINDALWRIVCHSFNKMKEKNLPNHIFAFKKICQCFKLTKSHCAS